MGGVNELVKSPLYFWYPFRGLHINSIVSVRPEIINLARRRFAVDCSMVDSGEDILLLFFSVK